MRLITRRKFLQRGTQGIVLASLPAFFNFDPLNILAVAEPGKLSVNDYLEHFGVTRAMITDTMQAALSRGGDYCDVYFQHHMGNFIVLEDGLVNRAGTVVDLGVGIRVLKGNQSGYSFTEEITPTAMRQAALSAANIADSSPNPPPAAFSPVPTVNYYLEEIPWETVTADKKIPLLLSVGEKAMAADSRIVKTTAVLEDDINYVLVATSDGVIVGDYQPMVNLSLTCTAEKNGQRESNYRGLSGRYGIEYFTPERLKEMIEEAVQRTVSLFDAVKPEGGEMPVALAAGSSGILLHEAIGHGMEADFNRTGASIFSDKIGRSVAESIVTIVDDGTLPGLRGSINIDDEGTPSQKTYLVENGILRSYMHDRISARHYQVQPTGNGRRQSFRFPPIPRMRNTYMLPGPHTKEEIIASIGKGLYAEAFTNGEVFIGPGDFSFYVKEGYLIENGKLTKPVKDINVVGNGPEVLRKIIMVGDDPAMAKDRWTCGKSGQSVPASQGLPTVKVASMTVGGISA